MKEPIPMQAQNCRITSREEIKSILDNSGICRLAFSDDGVPYVIPITYGYTYVGDVLTFFFHSSGVGRNIDIIKKNPTACLEIDCVYRLNPEDNPKRHAVKWESIIGSGTIEFVMDFYEKRMMLGNMMKTFRRYNPYYRPTPLTDIRVENVTMFKLTLDEFQAKRLHHI
jgi:nitroimidazol reductase NimA-like FMN-containing flavoprotein (pyridoxamine 5'-phosphate oxidase superfamily)